MGCGSSTATRTAGQPAPKLKRINEEEENASQSSSRQKLSSRPVTESNGHAGRIRENEGSGDESSTKQSGKVVTPPSSANGHVPHDSQGKPANGSGVLASDEQTNEETERGTADGAPRVEENADELENTAPENSASSAQENQSRKEESIEDAAPLSNDKATAELEQPVVMISDAAVGEVGGPSGSDGNDVKPEAVEGKPSGMEDVSFGDEAGVGTAGTDLVQNKVANEAVEGKPSEIEDVSVGGEPGVAAAKNDLVQNKVANEVSLSGETETGPSLHETNTASATSGIDSGAAETDIAQHRVASGGSLSGRIETDPVVDQSKRASIAASERSSAPSDNDVNLSRQNRGSVELDSVSPATQEGAQPIQLREISQEDSASFAQKESSFPVEASGSQLAEASRKDSVALDRKDSVAAANHDFAVKSDSIHERICTLTASVLIGSLDDPQGERTVTLHGSVYRLPGLTTPKPGDKIGFVTGDVTSTSVDNESNNKVATLRGDLLAVSGDAASHGQIATASIDVLSCANGEKVATITADVAPNDDSDSASGVISGEVLGASESGSYDEKIGTLAGKVVTLTFDEDTISINSSDGEFLKQRRESCFI